MNNIAAIIQLDAIKPAVDEATRGLREALRKILIRKKELDLASNEYSRFESNKNFDAKCLAETLLDEAITAAKKLEK